MHLEPTDVVYLLGAGAFALFSLTSGADAVAKTLALVVAAGVAAHALRLDASIVAPSSPPHPAGPGPGQGGLPSSPASRSSGDRDRDRRPERKVQMDAELYTLRAREGGTRHVALRRGGELLRRVRRAAALGTERGNTASGARALVALEDFFMRYHWALLKADEALSAGTRGHEGPDTGDLVSRTLSTMRDTRAVALNALAEIAFALPLPLAGPVRRAVAATRAETLACLEVLATRLARADPVAAQVASAAWRGPTPHDPLKESRDAGGYHQLF